jgi:hypothetical protein
LHATWAIQLILRDIATFSKKLQSGDIGDGDDAIRNSLCALIKEYFTQPLPTWCVSRGFDKLKADNLIPWNWLAKRTSNIRAFKNHPLRSNKALELALQEFIKAGALAETQSSRVWEKHEVRCKCYRVLEVEDSNGTAMHWLDVFLAKLTQ